MIKSLNTHRKQPASGSTRSLVILLHGYGADGKDLIGLADLWATSLPDTMFVAPDAPQICEINPSGRQWFPLSAAETINEMDTIHTLIQSFEGLQEFLDAETGQAGVPDSRTILVGFSQGTMMSLHVAPRRQTQLAGVVGFSGRMLFPSLLESQCKSKPPVILVHGEKDELVPASMSEEAATALKTNGIPVQSYVAPGLGHGIDLFGIGIALQFMRTRLEG